MHIHSIIIIIIWENKPYTTFRLYQIPGGSPTVVVLLYLSLCVVLNVLLITDLLQEGVAIVSCDLPVDRARRRVPAWPSACVHPKAPLIWPAAPAPQRNWTRDSVGAC